MQTVIIKLIHVYQRIAPKRLRQACRFEPSCSNYTILAIQKYGSSKGVIILIMGALAK
ncbi:membrane protein insertion efficiency factor YidD [candidate division KSB1 bacterium]|nr:membrane protein insertion efficiency factor YidD [candidate division KSB1 bacterium]